MWYGNIYRLDGQTVNRLDAQTVSQLDYLQQGSGSPLPCSILAYSLYPITYKLITSRLSPHISQPSNNPCIWLYPRLERMEYQD